jgi:hypothetical protein
VRCSRSHTRPSRTIRPASSCPSAHAGIKDGCAAADAVPSASLASAALRAILQAPRTSECEHSIKAPPIIRTERADSRCMGTRDALLISFSLLGVAVLIGEFLIAKVRTAEAHTRRCCIVRVRGPDTHPRRPDSSSVSRWFSRPTASLAPPNRTSIRPVRSSLLQAIPPAWRTSPPPAPASVSLRCALTERAHRLVRRRDQEREGQLLPSQIRLQMRVPVVVWRTRTDVCATFGVSG